MNKKNYKKPAMQVVNVNMGCLLAGGSGKVGKVQNSVGIGYGGGGNGVSRSRDFDDWGDDE